MADISGRRLGNYLLKSKIGGGGNGDVYLAEHIVLRRSAAVKVMNERQLCADDAEARFLREAQLASRLSHANAAQVYDCGVADDDGLQWIAMEFVDGSDLAAFLKAHGRMSLALAVVFFTPLAKAIDAAHKRGIVHRDIKPSNVMVVVEVATPSVTEVAATASLEATAPAVVSPKLIDFGIAKGEPVEGEAPIELPPEDHTTTDLSRITESVPSELQTGGAAHERRITRKGAAFGSRPYMAPEQFRNAATVGPAADIYSLAVVIHEALTGRRPFATDSTFTHRSDARPDHGLPAALQHVFCRALAKEPQQRHGSALELIRDLEGVLRADPNEQIRALTQRWQDSGQPKDLLASGQTLLELRRSVRSDSVAAKLSKQDASFIAKSLRRAQQARWMLGAIVALAIMAIVVVQAVVRGRMANRLALQSETEQGRQALLHGEFEQAVRHLEHAYRQGDESPELAFMLARSLQPRTSELAQFRSASGRMWSAVFSSDGKRVLTADDTSAQMWDAVSSQRLFSMPHQAVVYQAIFSRDGSQVITGSDDGHVRVWSAATGAPLRSLTWSNLNVKRWRYSAVATSAHLVAAVDAMGRAAHVWNDTGTPLAELSNDAGEFGQLAFSSDGRWLATTGGEEVRVFDTSTWERVATIPGPHIRSLAFHPSGAQLAVGTSEGSASLWELPNGVLSRRLRVAGESIDAIAFSPDGIVVATASREGAVQIWDTATGGLSSGFTSHRGAIHGIEFSSSGELLLSAGADGAVVVSAAATGMTVARLEGPTDRILSAHFDATSRRVVGASWDGTSRVWDATSPYRRWSSPPIGTSCETMDGLEPDRRIVAVSCTSQGTQVWDTARGELLAVLPEVTPVHDALNDYYSALPALTTTGDRIAIARGNNVEVYALPSGQLLRSIPHPAPVNAVAFAAVGHDLVSGATDGSLLLTKDDRDSTALVSAANGIDAVALLSDGRVLVADAGAHLRMIDPNRQALLMDVVAPSRIRLLRPSPDGTRLVTISVRSKQSPPALWDLERRQLVAELRHVGRVFSARFVRDGQEVLTAGGDRTARLWNAASGHQVHELRADTSLADAMLAADGATVIAGGSDGGVRFWNVSSERLLWVMQAHKTAVIGLHSEGNDIVTRAYAGDISRWSLPNSEGVLATCRASSCAATAAEEK